MDLIRGRDVNAALATLRFARKSVAKDVEKVLRSAIANATLKEGFGGDVERLFVNACYAEPGAVAEADPPRPDGPRVPHRQAHRAPDGASDRAAVEGDGRDGAATGEAPSATARGAEAGAAARAEDARRSRRRRRRRTQTAGEEDDRRRRRPPRAAKRSWSD